MHEEGQPSPLDSQPELPADLVWVWRAWEELRTCRSYSMNGPGPIPWSAIHEWAKRRGLTRDEEDDLAMWLWAIDAEMLKQE